MKFLFTLFIAFILNSNLAHADAVLDRVLKSKTLRCGFFVEAPFTIYNPNTGAFSGLSVELAEMIAKDLGFKLEWSEEIAFDTFGQDMQNGRYDMVCAGIFTLPRAASMFYSMPYAYAPVHGYVVKGNTNFDKDFESIDWKDIKVSGIDGEGATAAVERLIPETELVTLPQRSTTAEMLLQVQTKKTDIGFVLPTVFEEYNKNNPGKLKQAEPGKPLYQYAVGFATPRSAHDFRQIINQQLQQYIASGELHELAAKYDPKGLFKYPQRP